MPQRRMSEGEAKQLLKSGKVQQKGDSVIVDGKFVFGLNGKDAIDEIQPKKAEPKAEKKAEKKVEKKTEDKPLKEVKGKSLTKKPRKKKK